jgi:signal transduction histidine kinase
MPDRKKILNDLLRLEVAKKGQPASFAFFCFAILSFFFGYGCVRFLIHIKIICIALVITTICRFFLYQTVIKNNHVTKRQWTYMVTVITLNGLGFAAILNLASFELKLSGPYFVAVTTLIAGLVGSSTVTLSYFSLLFIPFQTFLLLPQIGIILYYYYVSPEHLNFLNLIVMYVMYYLYQLKQFQAYRKELIKLFTYQIELELKNRELNENKDVIMDQALKLVHTSRLAVVGEMSTSIAHEINNPLTIISGSAQALNRLGQSDHVDKSVLVKHSQKIERSIVRISKIVKGLKHFANQSDKVPKEKVEIQEIVTDTTQFCDDHLLGLGIKLQLDEVPQVRIHCHSIQISQVLINLLKNAADALTHEKREEEKWIAIHFSKDENFFYFIVSNGGERIPAEISEKLFRPFFTTKAREQGTGLGLSISQSIMKDHGGDLYYDPNYDVTTFIVKHPLVYSI